MGVHVGRRASRSGLEAVQVDYDADASFGSTYATHVYWLKKDNNDGLSNGDEDQYVETVLVLADRIGERTGWLGTRRYTDAWDTNPSWWHIGYPQDLTSVAWPMSDHGPSPSSPDRAQAPTVPAAAATWSTWRSGPGTTTPSGHAGVPLRALHQGVTAVWVTVPIGRSALPVD